MAEKRHYATRLNAFKAVAQREWPTKNRITVLDLAACAAKVPGLDAADCNYPDHLEGTTPKELALRLGELGLTLNGFAMRYYSVAEYKAGAFSHPDAAVRRQAIDLTKRGIDALAEAGGRLMTLWLGQDGYDYALQLDYARVWDLEIEGIRAVAAHNRDIAVSLEYKPDEPRAFALLRDAGTTLLAIKDAGGPNLGVTIDFAHSLYAGEMPALAATLVSRHARLLGVHLNDGYGKRDDGLMAGSVHPYETLDLLLVLDRIGYDGAIYFDTFPDASGLDPVAECALNIATIERLQAIAAQLAPDPEFNEARARQDAVSARRIAARALHGL
jgi:xylose isomerase